MNKSHSFFFFIWKGITVFSKDILSWTCMAISILKEVICLTSRLTCVTDGYWITKLSKRFSKFREQSETPLAMPTPNGQCRHLIRGLTTDSSIIKNWGYQHACRSIHRIFHYHRKFSKFKNLNYFIFHLFCFCGSITMSWNDKNKRDLRYLCAHVSVLLISSFIIRSQLKVILEEIIQSKLIRVIQIQRKLIASNEN